MPSEKTQVIERLFFRHWDAEAQRLTKSVMTFSDVLNGIRECNRDYGTSLSDRNPANFMKDIVRGQNASQNWPTTVTRLRYTAIQLPGEGNVFKFVPFKVGQTEPFPDCYRATEHTQRFKIETVSMPQASKRLGRSDESWLIQTAVRLRVVESHFAVVSQIRVSEITHLQMSVKLRKTEIDALFLATIETDDDYISAIVTCEAKMAKERILEHQIIEQARSAFEETDAPIVIPLGIRAVKNTGLYVVEFDAVERGNHDRIDELVVASEAVYELVPRVPGI